MTIHDGLMRQQGVEIEVHCHIRALIHHAVKWLDPRKSTHISFAHSCPDACNRLCNDFRRHTLPDGHICSARDCPHQAVQDSPGRHADYEGASGT